MPAKKKSSARKTAARKPAKKTTAKKKPAPRKPAKKTTAKKKPATKNKKAPAAKKKPARARVKRGANVAPELAIEHQGSVPDSVLAIAQRATEQQMHTRAGRKARAQDQMAAVRDDAEPEEILDRLAEASRPAAVIQERMDHEPSDTLSMPDHRSTSDPDLAAAPPPARKPIGDVVIDVDNLHVFYGAVQSLRGISFRVHEGETVAIIGSNGAGKTTTLKTVSGVSELLKTVRGSITIMGERVENKPAHKIARLGVAHSPEGRKVFPNQTVRDNLMLGAFNRTDNQIEHDIKQMEERFPILGQRRNQPAGLMSGGEQQMLAMGRALMARPKVLLFDEPSMGLAPLIVQQIFDIIEELKREGKTILLVEQMAFQALAIADRGYVLETGEITMEGIGGDLLDDPRVKEAYLGA